MEQATLYLAHDELLNENQRNIHTQGRRRMNGRPCTHLILVITTAKVASRRHALTAVNTIRGQGIQLKGRNGGSGEINCLNSTALEEKGEKGVAGYQPLVRPTDERN